MINEFATDPELSRPSSAIHQPTISPSTKYTSAKLSSSKTSLTPRLERQPASSDCGRQGVAMVDPRVGILAMARDSLRFRRTRPCGDWEPHGQRLSRQFADGQSGPRS